MTRQARHCCRVLLRKGHFGDGFCVRPMVTLLCVEPRSGDRLRRRTSRLGGSRRREEIGGLRRVVVVIPKVSGR